jgi:O-acetylserine/cysteine efflux transporter
LRPVPWPAVGAVLYVGLLATVAGFGAWGFLIRTYSASSTAPFSLLVPVFGMAAAAVFTGETITPVQVVAGVLVIAGVLTGLGYAAARPSPAISPASTSG